MLQQTLQRLAGIETLAPALLVCSESSRFIVAEQLREIGLDNARMVLEPVRRNTAPAIATAALQAMENGNDPVLLVLPSDHVILDTAAFHRAISVARAAAEEGKLLTFGIKPAGPETGYGYIRVEEGEAGQVQRIVEFVEKPVLALAEQYVASGNYFWNSGMFLFRAETYLQELGQFQPAMRDACVAAVAQGHRDLDFCRLEEQAFTSCPSDSIDYAVMEHTAHAVVLPAAIGWNDVGSWLALWEVQQGDASGNVVRGDVYLDGVRNCLVRAERRMVAVLGVQDLVIVETDDAVLVAHKDQVQRVKQVVDHLKQQGRTEHVQHRKVYRPWGSYEGIDLGERFQVKRITVNPGGKLSLQMHHHRAEHWVVVSGTASVTCGEKVTLLTENESTYIPIGMTHRLENPGKLPLHLIEVQSGSYLGEDDIVRLEDVYQRT